MVLNHTEEKKGGGGTSEVRAKVRDRERERQNKGGERVIERKTFKSMYKEEREREME